MPLKHEEMLGEVGKTSYGCQICSSAGQTNELILRNPRKASGVKGRPQSKTSNKLFLHFLAPVDKGRLASR